MALLTTALAALVGAGIGTALRLPAGPLLGAMIAVGALKVSGIDSFDLPSPFRWVVYCAVGWLLGQTFTAESVQALKTYALPIGISVTLFLAFGFLLAWGLWRFAHLDAYTAALAAAPGGIAQIGVLSAEAKGANVPVVLAIHVLRITSVIVLVSVGLRVLGERS